jgi:hypothetical protein
MLILNENNIVTPDPEILIIPAFKEIWDKDKTKDKINALQTLAYIYFKYDLKSRYRNSYQGKELDERIKEDLFGSKTFKFTNDISGAEKIYDSLQTSKSLKLLLAAESAMDQITNYFSNFDLENIEEADRPDVINKLMRNLKEVDEVSSKLETAKKKIEEDLLAKIHSTRRKLSKWEIPK